MRRTGIKRGRLVARRCGKLKNKLKGGCSECPESQSDGTAPNETAWSALAVTIHSRREGLMEGIVCVSRHRFAPRSESTSSRKKVRICE
jgi:hypothetical protein